MTTPLLFADRVYEQSTATGTGMFVLNGAVLGYQSFSVFGNGNQAYYVIAQNMVDEWEVGLGTINIVAGVTQLTRNTVLASSNAGALVDFDGIGLKDVRNPMPAEVLSGIIYANGTIPFTADQSMGGFLLQDVGDAVSAKDAVNLETAAALIAAAADGNVATSDPSVVDDVAVFDSTSGHVRGSGTVQVLSAAEDKLKFGASFGLLAAAVDGATVTVDFNESDQWFDTLAGNNALAYTNASVGQIVKVLLIQDGTGGRVPSWWSQIYWNNGLAPELDPAPNGRDLIVLACVGTVTISSMAIPVWEEVCRKTSAPRKSIVTVTYGATTTFDLRSSRQQMVTLAGSPTLAVTAGTSQKPFMIGLIQDATGSRTVGTWFPGITWPVPITLSTTPEVVDWLCFIPRSLTSPKYDFLGASLGNSL